MLLCRYSTAPMLHVWKYNELADRLPDHSAAAALTRHDGLMADRFYGTPDLNAFAIAKCWVYRLRIKSNIKVFEGGHKTALGEHVSDRLPYLASLALTQRRIITNIGIINEPGHPEPWIIAMSDTSVYLTTLDYSAGWGIEPMFSDFKSRGPGLEQSQLRTPERLGRLLLVMSLAL